MRDRGGLRAPAAPPRARAVCLLRLAAILLAALPLLAAAPVLRPPRDAATITRLLSEGPHSGECETCHTMHAEGRASPQAGLLLAPADNRLCASCHETEWTTGSWTGLDLYTGSAHGSSARMIWPGPDPPPRIEPDAAGKCMNCHDPHGWTDATGKIPRLALQREEELCLACHDGSPASSAVQSDFQKPFRHPAPDFTGRHAGAGESSPADFGRAPVNRRHAECEDCHNPHAARADLPGGPAGSDASRTTFGTSRVRVLNGAAGSVPAYDFRAASDTLGAPAAEHELCFKCHSSWTTQPTGQTDLARVLNPANPSYHPVEAAGRNANIAPGAFEPGWSSFSLTRCGDCHGSDFGVTRGPHGSIHRWILRAPYDPSPARRTMASNELCFQCHRWEVYANNDAPESVQALSRFNPPGADKGHAWHVDNRSAPCGTCHVTHGSTDRPFLIAVGRSPGIVSYTKSANGGTCAATCHGSKSYTVNYAR